MAQKTIDKSKKLVQRGEVGVAGDLKLLKVMWLKFAAKNEMKMI